MGRPFIAFLAQTANGNSQIESLPLSDGPGSDAEIRTYHVTAEGTWDTATLTMQWRRDAASDWIAAGFTKTDDASGTVQLARGQVRFNLASVGVTTDLNVTIDG